MTIHCYNPVHFETWRWDTPDTRGIGGSETAATEVCHRLASRGYPTVCYVPLPEEDRAGAVYKGTTYRHLADADFAAAGLWIIFRDAACLEKLPKTADQQVWLVCQDESPRGVSEQTAAKIDRVIALCQWHKAHLEQNWPILKGKISVSANGLKGELLDQSATADLPNRNPCRLMYASSPDRGLLQLLKIFRRLREFVPDAELHCFYGTDNIKKLIDFNPQFKSYQKLLDALEKELNQPGVTWHGRVSQEQLYREWLKTGIWCYPTNFGETSCITSMEAQALGAVPVTRPLAALAENVMHGVLLDGDTNDPLVQARYVGELIKLCWHPQLQEQIRTPMVTQARTRFTWERVVDQWEGWMRGWDSGLNIAQFAFQRRHAAGRVLNIGCADDPAGFAARGAVNLDALATVPWSGRPTAAQVLHDARTPLPDDLGRFDTVIIGDLLEHLGDSDAIAVLTHAVAVLNPGGRVVITCPQDHRPADQQHARQDYAYLPGESAYHERPVTAALLEGWLSAAGLTACTWGPIDYGMFTGHGIVAARSFDDSDESHSGAEDRAQKRDGCEPEHHLVHV